MARNPLVHENGRLPTGLITSRHRLGAAAYFASGHFPGASNCPSTRFVGPETPDRGFLGAAGNTVGLRPHLPRSHIKCRHWTHGMSAARPGHSGNQA